MTRASRFATFAAVGASLYFLIWFSILPVPLLGHELKDEIMPVVSGTIDSHTTALLKVIIFTLDPLVAHRLLRLVLAVLVRDGIVHFQ